MKIVWIRLRFTPERINCNCVPSPQSNRKTSPLRMSAVEDSPRVSVGTAELVPKSTIFKCLPFRPAKEGVNELGTRGQTPDPKACYWIHGLPSEGLTPCPQFVHTFVAGAYRCLNI